MKGFKQLLRKAQLGDQEAVRTLLELYRGLILKESNIDGAFDEDLMQTLFDTLMSCIRNFKI